MRFFAFILFMMTLVECKHYLLYSKPANELYLYDSYFCSKNLCSTDFALQLRNATKSRGNSSI